MIIPELQSEVACTYMDAWFSCKRDVGTVPAKGGTASPPAAGSEAAARLKIFLAVLCYMMLPIITVGNNNDLLDQPPPDPFHTQIEQWNRKNRNRYADNAAFLVRPGLLADKKTAAVSLYARATTVSGG